MTATVISEMVLRRRSTVEGQIAEVRPSAAARRRLDVEVVDGTGSIVLRFLGRADIPGMEPGRRLRAEGTPAELSGERVMLNPVYFFIPCGHQ